VARVVFHLHCYQPPREDPWTGAVPTEPSAAPAHDWNERITDECYRPLGAARILDEAGLIRDAPNLYRDVSVDVGPTLHRWIEQHAPDVDAAIRHADRGAALLHEGHGAAIAQPYVHAILPLANRRDRDTLVRWGLADFRRRFGREAEGMWLPEAAVDVDTLESLAANGVQYTILGDHQARRVRRAGGEWQSGDALDTGEVHLVRLPSGGTIRVCFYDGHLSHAIAFDRTLLTRGEQLGAAVEERISDGRGLVLVATDAETFGHHHRFGEMALARALDDVSRVATARVGGLGALVAAIDAPDTEVDIVSPSSWSCAHGVERWRADCGDATGGEPHWNQQWRAPLRAAVDLLARRAAEQYEAVAARIVHDPWGVRDAYGDVIDASTDERVAFVRAHTRSDKPSRPTITRMLGLLEMQRHVLLALSSCAWFFSDCAGLETSISLRNAARAVELLRMFGDLDIDAEIAAALAPMQSNEWPELDGRALWRNAVESAFTSMHAAATWAATTLAGAATTQIGRLRIEATGFRHEGPVDAPTSLEATVTVVDDATTQVSSHAVRARATPIDLRVDAGAFFTLADLPIDVRTDVLARLWTRLLARAAPATVQEIRDLTSATSRADVAVDRATLAAVLQRAAAVAIDEAARNPTPGLHDLAFVVDALDGALPPSLRWSAQNVLLDIRENVRPIVRARPTDDGAAQEWLAEFDRTAARLGVTP
jgi:hypothetical protein